MTQQKLLRKAVLQGQQVPQQQQQQQQQTPPMPPLPLSHQQQNTPNPFEALKVFLPQNQQQQHQQQQQNHQQFRFRTSANNKNVEDQDVQFDPTNAVTQSMGQAAMAALGLGWHAM